MNKDRRGPGLKRVYEKPGREDGFRILVDRLWPRGLSKEKASVDAWLKDIAPSDRLRKWFNHDPRKWSEFKTRYRRELATKTDLVTFIQNKFRQRKVTLLYGAADTKYNNAAALKDYLIKRASP